MTSHVLSAAMLALAGFTCTAAVAQCPVTSKLKEPTIFLIDKSDNIVKGPLDFGTVETEEGYANDRLVKSTDYRLLLFPARVSIEEDIGNLGLDLKKVESLCPNSTTFAVGVGMVFNGRPGAISPWKVDTAIDLRFFDKKLDYVPKVKLAFDGRIVGIQIETKAAHPKEAEQ